MKLVVTSDYGRLGNRLFLYAHVIACAIENNLGVINPCLGDYAKFFRATVSDPLCRYPAHTALGVNRDVSSSRRRYQKIASAIARRWSLRSGPMVRFVADNEQREFRLDAPDFLRQLEGPGVALLRGYFFRDYFALNKHQPIISQHFALNEEHASNVSACIADARVDIDKLVGVHIRRGDYRNWQGGKYFYTDEQYQTKFEEISRLFPGQRIRFLIASDEKIDVNAFSGMDCMLTTGDIVEDIYCLAETDQIVGPFSTYSSWASYVGATPIYFIHEIEKVITAASFQTYEEVCIEHMNINPAFPTLT